MKIYFGILALLTTNLIAGEFSGGGFLGKPFTTGNLKTDPIVGTNNLSSELIGGVLGYSVSKSDEVGIKIANYHFGAGEKNPIFLNIPATETAISTEWQSLNTSIEWRHTFNSSFYALAGAGLSFVKMDATTWFRPTAGGNWVGSTVRLDQSGRPNMRVGAGRYFSKMVYSDISYNWIGVKKDGNNGFGINSLTSVDIVIGITWGR